ncbi:hypothetical protein JIN81_15745 [Haloferula rosea]|uniref:MvaI/BcnI restriction endonuclease domain-containing protein n=1 Tax=Haloferula rosea TaxID=490093 RepID=A0A934RH86_9BACT|nr:hypothetical protein [Haloferula rosea]
MTETGLQKNILDATAPHRELFRDNGFHCYDTQGQGEANKVTRDAVIFDHGQKVGIPIFLYRPKTKKGDPRFWLSRLRRFVDPGDVLAVFFHDGVPHFANLTKDDEVNLEAPETDWDRLLESLRLNYEAVGIELLGKLRDLAASGPIPADGTGDTSIGRTIETALGIQINSSQSPDYKGIELKSKRSRSKTRNGLFAKVPDWRISDVGDFREMLERFGYPSPDGLRLYCTVSSKSPNSQGLLLRVDEDAEVLHELARSSAGDKAVCAWRLSTLHVKLQEKHRETFWIRADELKVGAQPCFQLTEVTHTKRPSNIQFDRLLSEGSVTVDHMIKMLPTRVHERGPQFKVARGELHELFLGAPKIYDLT